jgi:glycine dehydrogenase
MNASLSDYSQPAPAETSLNQLEAHDNFHIRHIGPTPAEQQYMLSTLGMNSMRELIDAAVPPKIRCTQPLDLPNPINEHEALAKLKTLAEQNQIFRSLIGQGYYGTYTPSVILRNVLENPAWYTAYTPYQPEISQGRLEAMLNFQQMVCDLTGMDIANASMLDEATAAAEAMMLAKRLSKSTSATFFVADDVLPQTIEVLHTRAAPLNISLLIGPAHEAAQTACFGALIQYPGANGGLLQHLSDYQTLAKNIQDHGALVIAAADLLALTQIEAPSVWGADVVIGSSQRFGVPMGFGGPHAAYFAVRDKHKRAMPGRLVGVSVDANGKRAYRLALQTREQHIRREKATSNICTAQVLLAVIASMYAVYHGPQGLKRIGQRVHRLTSILASGLAQLGYTPVNPYFFDTLSLQTVDKTQTILDHARNAGLNLRMIDAQHIGISLDEISTAKEVQKLWEIFAQGQALPDFSRLEQQAQAFIPVSLKRSTPYLTHAVFNSYHTEHEMLRYLRRLADKDLALDRSMIPLGSCTMKLNASTEMLPVTWPAFADIHPFAPVEQTQGYRTLITQLEHMLCVATGYAAVSLQPNAGSQGEYAGLLIIRAYHQSRGQGERDVCLIPASAHGTNPASAYMAGMRVIPVACDQNGNVDLVDLEARAAEHRDRLAAIMITYPSTHGVFEAGIQQICDIIHQYGGQVYIDGANMNALVGIASPGQFGGDVSHLNLHKTFCIPHGGGGPGVGPVAVAQHLAPFLPNAKASGYIRGSHGISAISATPYGSASILPISWMYITMMGGTGLTAATENAILAANYIAKKLAPYFPILYKGQNDLVAHECILDLRALKEATNISNEDVAKRLIDYGFHAPTMSFPVPGTLMVEPTESESLAELDRFIEAMIQIRQEIDQVQRGTLDAIDNPLKNAPHTAEQVTANEWHHTYTREQAAFPVHALRQQKYWPPVGRADNAYGDRNLFCNCPPLDALIQG